MAAFQDDSMMDVIGGNGDLMGKPIANPMDVNAYATDIDLDMDLDLGNSTNSLLNSVEHCSNPLADNSQVEAINETLGTQAMSGAGAGPLPTGFGVQSGANAGSTLTEFTKRRNWSQRVLEELKDLLCILSADGRFLFASLSTKALTGHDPQELAGKFFSEYVHVDDSSLFVREFNESIATGNPLRFYFRFRNADGSYSIYEAHGHPHLSSEAALMASSGMQPQSAAGYCRGFFMMARPYPTKNAELLDSFLEHKIENQRLEARIHALKCEEAEDHEAQARHYQRKVNGQTSLTPTDSANDFIGTPPSTPMNSRGDSAANVDSYSSSMPPPAKPTVSNTALTREALDEANAFSRPDSITDKMARYERSSHVDSIEMMTGLRYREGERALGISTGGASPALVRGDAGIDIPADKTDPRYGTGNPWVDGKKSNKKVKSADEHVCTDCGTLDSPEWRKGPSGPKTLCNACGLRWAKKEKKIKGGQASGSGSALALTPGVLSTPGGGSTMLGLMHSSSNDSQMS